MKAQSISGHSINDIKVQLEACIQKDFHPTLAIVFMSISQNPDKVSEFLDSYDIQVFGSTTNGEFIDDEPLSKSVSILLLDIDLDCFKIYHQSFTDKNYRTTSKNIAIQAKSEFSNPAFLMSISNPESDGEEVLRGIESVTGKDVTAFGSGAGDDLSFTGTYVFTNEKGYDHGMVCLVIDQDKIQVEGIASCGWKAVGTEKTVTKSEGNHVFTIDNEPAVDITTKYGGLENVNPENQDLLIELAANFPLQLQREYGDPVMRPALVVDWSDRSFYTSGTVPEGAKVRFSIPPDFDVMDKVIKDLEHLKSTKMSKADAIIVFSCAGRLLSLGPLINEELKGIKEVWDVPMVGMFSNAELGRSTGGNLEMHNLTSCTIALKEK